MEKNCGIFVAKQLYFLPFQDFTFFNHLGLWLDLDRELDVHEWFWIAKYDTVRSSLVCAQRCALQVPLPTRETILPFDMHWFSGNFNNTV